MKFNCFEMALTAVQDPAPKRELKAKKVSTVSVLKEAKLAVDGISFKGFSRCIVDDTSMITACLDITAKLICKGEEILVSVPAEVVKMDGDELADIELEICSHSQITTPCRQFEIKPGELVSEEYISDEIYISRGERILRLAQLHDDWTVLKARIRFEMRSRLS